MLGVIVDDNLKWTGHIVKVKNKIASAVGVLSKIRHLIDQKTSLIIYEALIASNINYCNIVWGYGYKTSLDPIYILQKRALKMCLHLPKKTNATDIFNKSNKLTIYEINTLQVAMFTFNVINQNVPFLLSNFFTLTTDIHNHYSRNKLTLFNQPTKSNLQKFSVGVRGPVIWNPIPPLIKQTNSSSSFKFMYKKYLINLRNDDGWHDGSD